MRILLGLCLVLQFTGAWAQQAQYKVVALPSTIDFGEVQPGDTAIRKYPAYIQGAQYWQGPWQSSATVSFSPAFKVLNTPLFYYSPIVPASDSIAFAFVPVDTVPASAYIVVTVGSAQDSIAPMRINVRGNYREPGTGNQPRIDSMMIDELRDQLLIYGAFDTEPDSVTVNNTRVQIIRWTPYWLRCELPFSGKGSSGPVIVRKGSITSEPRNITAINFLVEKEWRAQSNGISHTERQATNVRLRADIESRIRSGSFTPVSFLARGIPQATWAAYIRWSSRSAGQGLDYAHDYPWMDSTGDDGVAFYGSLDLQTLHINGTLKLRGGVVTYGYSSSATDPHNTNWRTTYDTSGRALNHTDDLALPLTDSFTVIPQQHSGTKIGYFVTSYQIDTLLLIRYASTEFAPLLSPRGKWVSLYPMEIDLGDVYIGDTAYGKVGAFVAGGVPWHGGYLSEVVRVSGDEAFEAVNHPLLHYTATMPMDSIVIRFVPISAGPASATFRINAGSELDSIRHSGFIIRANGVQPASVDDEDQLRIYVDHATRQIRNLSLGASVTIIDVLGRTIANYDSDTEFDRLPDLPRGYYQVLVKTSDRLVSLPYLSK